MRTALQQDTTAEAILKRFISALKRYPKEALAPYEEFRVGSKTYYFTPGGFLYCKEESGTEERGSFFCGYLTDEVWHYKTDDS